MCNLVLLSLLRDSTEDVTGKDTEGRGGLPWPAPGMYFSSVFLLSCTYFFFFLFVFLCHTLLQLIGMKHGKPHYDGRRPYGFGGGVVGRGGGLGDL